VLAAKPSGATLVSASRRGNIEPGTHPGEPCEMLPVFGEDIGRNIFFVPLNERRKQLEAIPWVSGPRSCACSPTRFT